MRHVLRVTKIGENDSADTGASWQKGYGAARGKEAGRGKWCILDTSSGARDVLGPQQPGRGKARGYSRTVLAASNVLRAGTSRGPPVLARDFDAPFLVRFEQGDIGIDHQFYQA